VGAVVVVVDLVRGLEGGKFRFDLGTEKKKGRKKEERVLRLRASNKWYERVCWVFVMQ